MTNREYADAVAKRMGWVLNGSCPDCIKDLWVTPGHEFYTVHEFTPAESWYYAGIWLEWLISNGAAVTFSSEDVGYANIVCNIDDTIEGDGTYCSFVKDGSILEAFTEASKKFLEATND